MGISSATHVTTGSANSAGFAIGTGQGTGSANCTSSANDTVTSVYPNTVLTCLWNIYIYIYIYIIIQCWNEKKVAKSVSLSTDHMVLSLSLFLPLI